MKRRLTLLALAWVAGALIAPASTRAAGWLEDFATDPGSRGWTVVGDPALFRWDPTSQRLAATWDSTRTNTFFHRRLGTILTRAESFQLRFALQLDEIQTDNPDGTFQLAVGLLRRVDAFRESLRRGSGIHPVSGGRSFVEFNYFPPSRTIAPTLAAVAAGTNYLRWAMANLFPFEITTGTRHEVTLAFDAPTQTLRVDVRRDGEPWASGQTRLDDRFGDFRLDAVSVTSYSGANQPAGYGGQILARGWIDDLSVEHPDPPAVRLVLHHGHGPSDPLPRVVGAMPAAGWTSQMESSPDALEWTPVGIPAVPDPTGTLQTWTLPSSSAPAHFFRLRLDRP